MTELVDLIAATLTRHQGPEFMDGKGTVECFCDFDCTDGGDVTWAKHVAREVVAVLSAHPDTLMAVLPEDWQITRPVTQEEEARNVW